MLCNLLRLSEVLIIFNQKKKKNKKEEFITKKMEQSPLTFPTVSSPHVLNLRLSFTTMACVVQFIPSNVGASSKEKNTTFLSKLQFQHQFQAVAIKMRMFEICCN